MSTLFFNTGRPYAEHGQRIGAKIVGNYILMWDIDRELWYLVSGDFTQTAIMRAYDHGDGSNDLELVPIGYADVWEFEKEVRAHWKNISD